MKKKHLSRSWLLGGLVSLTFAACSNEVVLEQSPTLDENKEVPKITIAVGTPSSGAVEVTRGVTTYDDQTEDDAKINNLKIYLFKYQIEDGSSVTGTDSDYKFYKVYTKDASTNGFILTLNEENNTVSTCEIDIDGELIDQTVKIALVANESMTDPTEETDLATFLNSTATASVSTSSSSPSQSDVLVGGTTKKSFPMTAIAETTDGSKSYTLTAAGVDLSATLVRNVARIDIFNYTPNLIIKEVKINNVINKSYLFGIENNIHVPTAADVEGVTTVSLAPLKEYSERYTPTGIPYETSSSDASDGETNNEENTNESESGTDTEATGGTTEETTVEDLEAARKMNTFPAFYLYEQSVSEESCPTVTIEYLLKLGNGNYKGTIEVPFQRESGYVDVVRNTLYTIRLGEGESAVTEKSFSCTLIVNDVVVVEYPTVLNPSIEGD